MSKHQQHIDRAATAGGRLGPMAEVVAWVAGTMLLVSAGGRYVEGQTAGQHSIRQFEELQALAQQPAAPDVTLWSPARVDAWKGMLQAPVSVPLAILRIPRLGLEAPVLEGTGEAALNSGVGHIENTAAPGAHGHVGIAGHRDGFFRGLKDIRPGDTIELDTLPGIERYLVERTWIVEPTDVSVLDPEIGEALTLVTCYPFYYVGPAPERFIVRAVRVGLRVGG